MSNRHLINQSVVQSAESALHHHHYVSPVDVFINIGFLQPVHVQEWRKGKIPYLESVMQGSLGKISFAMECLRTWAHQKGLKPSQTAYLARTRGPKRDLQFSKSGHPTLEAVYRTHYISPLLSEKKKQKLQEKLEKPPDLVVFMITKESQCSHCHEELGKGRFLFREADRSLCLGCAGFGSLVFLASGDAKLTRAVKKYSRTCIIVVRFSKARKRYERQGILVDKGALHKGENEGISKFIGNDKTVKG